MSTATMNFKTDEQTKKEFNAVAKDLGLTSSALLNVLVTRVAKEKAIPFKVEVVPEHKEKEYDQETKKEMIRQLAIENDLIPDTDRRIDDVDQYFKDLGI